MTVRDSMRKWALETQLNGLGVPEDAEVSFRDDTTGGCPTCGPEYSVEIEAYWQEPDAAGRRRSKYKSVSYWGTLGALIEEISEWEGAQDA